MSKIKVEYWLAFVLLGTFLFSCKVQEKENYKLKIKHRPTTFIVDKLKKKEFNFETISAKASVSIEDSIKKSSFKIHLRARKDSAIWMSITPLLGIEVARVLITKDSVMFLNRASKEYFIGDFNYLNTLFGTDLDYQMLEALLVGNSIDFEENDKIYSRIDRKKDLYLLSTEKKRKIKMELKKEKEKFKKQAQVLWLDPITFKIRELLLSSPESNRSLTGTYSDFKEVDSQIVPHKLNFKLESKTVVTIDVDFSKFSFGKSLSFPFNISTNYVQIKK